jgi:ribosomal protein S18 acetylase RimI-like enzyme
MDWAQSLVGKKYFTDVVNNQDMICLIAEDDNTPVGYVAAKPKEFSYRLSKYLEIENMGVSPNYRSKGIGSRLIKKVLELAKKKGFQKIYVSAYSNNVKAIDFYEKNGFKKIDAGLERSI